MSGLTRRHEAATRQQLHKYGIHWIYLARMYTGERFNNRR